MKGFKSKKIIISKLLVLAMFVSLVGSDLFFPTLDVKAAREPSLTYRAHCQTFGWLPWVKDGVDAGTEGLAKRCECIQIELDSDIEGSIEYSVHCQTYGWLPWVKEGQEAGTTGQSKRLEAMKIVLTGKIANYYDVEYRAHCQTYGWLPWVKNGEVAGTEGQAKRLEAYEVRLVKKKGVSVNDNANIEYRVHCQTYGWLDAVADGDVAGTTGQAKRLEAIEIYNRTKYSGDIVYRSHCQTYGWFPWVKNGEEAGITGQSKRMEAIQIYLTGELAQKYDIYYRTHCQTYGWLGWAKNNQKSGTAGYAKRMEAIQIVLVEKGGKAPGDTTNCYVSSYPEDNKPLEEEKKPDDGKGDGKEDDEDKKPNDGDEEDKKPDDKGEPSDDSNVKKSFKEAINSASLEYTARTGEAIIDKRVDLILSKIIKDDMTNYQKVKAVYDWLIKNNHYAIDETWRCQKSYKSKFDTWCANQSYSALLLGYGSCKNYASAFVVLTRALGFESFKVCGYAPGSQEHGWAVIRINGKYYHFDPQMDDMGSSTSYRYFGKTDAEFIKLGFVLCGDDDAKYMEYINGFNYFK